MTEPLKQLIDQEMAKIRLLEADLASRRHRVEMLKSMQTPGEFDAFLDGKIAGPKTAETPRASPPAVQRVPEGAWPVPPVKAVLTGDDSVDTPPRRKKGEVKLALLSLLNRETPKHLSELIQEMGRMGYKFGSTRMRAEMWTYKTDGLVVSDHPGLFCLSENGQAFLERQKGESPAATGLSGVTTSVEGDLA